MRPKPAIFVALAVLASQGPLLADDLRGAERFLCTAAEASQCTDSGECVSAPPWSLNIPNFILVDLAKKQLATTEASGERRVTPINNLQRQDGLIVLQGVESGRAFSFVIDEESGMVTVGVARSGMTVTVFGPCTPTPSK